MLRKALVIPGRLPPRRELYLHFTMARTAEVSVWSCVDGCVFRDSLRLNSPHISYLVYNQKKPSLRAESKAISRFAAARTRNCFFTSLLTMTARDIFATEQCTDFVQMLKKSSHK
jgi:hypothetical protein